MELLKFIFFCALALLGVAGASSTITQCVVDDSWRKQIAEHGCAGFYLDGNGDKQWNWKKTP